MKEGGVEGREREGPQVTVEPGPLSISAPLGMAQSFCVTSKI